MPFPPAKSESSICPCQDVVLNILQLCLCLLLALWHCFLTRWYSPLWSASSGAYVHLPDYFGPNKWTKLTLVELKPGWEQKTFWLLSLTVSLAGTVAKVHTTETLENQCQWSITTSVKKRKMHLSLLNFFTVFLLRVFFFPPRPTEDLGWGERKETLQTYLPPASLWKKCTAGCLVQNRCLSVMCGLISVNQSLLFYTSCPFIQKSPEGS